MYKFLYMYVTPFSLNIYYIFPKAEEKKKQILIVFYNKAFLYFNFHYHISSVINLDNL